MTLTDSFTVTFTINLKGRGEGLVLLDNAHGTKVKRSITQIENQVHKIKNKREQISHEDHDDGHVDGGDGSMVKL